MSLLRLDRVSRRYRTRQGVLRRAGIVHAVDDVSLVIDRARTLGIVGESGCGKSTTGRLALGIEQPDGGEVYFEGEPVTRVSAKRWRQLRAQMQMVFQDPLGALDKRLTVAAQVAEPLMIHGIGTREERRARVAYLLHSVGLRPDHGKRYPHELSGGQRQRVVLARALATSPALLVCDEPVSALDVSIQAQVVNLLTDLQAEFGVAMLFISHDLRVVRQVSHEVAVMYLGRIVEQGDPDAIFTDPLHPYSHALVSALPRPGQRRDQHVMLRGEPPNPADRPTGCAFHPRCPIAIAACAHETPALQRVSDGRHVACLRVPSTALCAA